MTDKLLFTGSEWSFDKIEKTWAVIDEIGSKQLGFDYYPAQIEIISSEQMIDNYSTHAMPQMYNHWSFGKTFIQNQNSYKSGQSGLAYEVVINTNPSIAYLMETNSMTLQALVMAHACVDGDTECLTPAGWVKIKDYVDGTPIGTYSLSGELTFEVPLDYIKTKTNSFYEIKARGVSQKLTPDHRMYFKEPNGKWKVETAEEFVSRHHSKTRGHIGRFDTAFHYSGKGIGLTPAEIQLAVAIKADGSFYNRVTSGHFNCVEHDRVRFHLKKKRKIDRLVSILRELDIEYSITPTYEGRVKVVFNVPGGKYTKQYDSSWYNASHSQLELIGEEVLHWDGSIRSSSFSTINKADADYIQFVWASMGFGTNIGKDKSKENICYNVSRGSFRLRSISGSRNGRAEIGVVSGRNMDAYCFTTSTSLWLARKDDCIFATGNCIGHSSFFKTNYLFREWSDADSILDYLKFAKSYIDKCEKQHGEDEVEAILDACHSLQLHGVDKYKKPDFRNELAKQQAREAHAEATYSDLWKVTSNVEHLAPRATGEFQPEENILYFIEKHSPILKPWQREIVRIVRKIAQYFYPQRQTGLLNEGYACLNHHVIMNMMYDQGYITAGSAIEFLKSHAGVVAQPDWNSKYFSGINVYALGYAMMADIKRMCETPDAEDKRLFPRICNTDWRETIKHVVANYRDESFISQFLSPKVCRQLKLFTIDMDEEHSYHRVSSVCPDESLHNIRSALSAQYDLSKRVPHIEIVNVDWEGDRTLTLNHFSSNGVMLGHDDLKKTAGYLHELWGHTVKMEYKNYDGEDI